MNPDGILERVDRLIAVFVPPLASMGDILSQKVTVDVGEGNKVMYLSNAALAAFVMPWVTDLGAILTALADFLDAL